MSDSLSQLFRYENIIEIPLWANTSFTGRVIPYETECIFGAREFTFFLSEEINSVEVKNFLLTLGYYQAIDERANGTCKFTIASPEAHIYTR
jgi:hypothetical protein